jgi:hypothetical protein
MTIMNREPYPTPILFLVFNRPDVTRVVLREIRKVKPAKLFIASDGPRLGVGGEEEKVEEVRSSTLSAVDWDCDVQTLFRSENLGCRRAVMEAISWYFDNVEEGIILEDDCAPHPSFFTYCGELLDRYRNDPRVMMISGDNFQDGVKRGCASYYFSRYAHIWGWASWRRAWRKMDRDLSTYGAFRNEGQLGNLFDSEECDYWRRVFDAVKRGEIDTWDYAWFYSVLSQGGVSAMPNVNLVSNIGFGGSATHTKGSSKNAGLPRHDIGIIDHPSFVLPHGPADRYTFETQWSRRGFWNLLRGFLGRTG